MPATRAARGLVVVLVTVLAAGCGTASTPIPSPSTPGGPTGAVPAATTDQGGATSPAAPTLTPTASPAYADTLRLGVDLGYYRRWQPAIELGGVPMLTFGRLVYSGLYRYDGRDDAIPDLADGPCFVPGADGKVIRCRLVETTFHDGTPLTADDVAYTYQVFARPVLTWGLPTEVRVVDDRTVDFVLPAVDPTFMTTTLPLIPIFSRRSIVDAVAAFDAGTKGLTPADLATLAADIAAEIDADPPVCSEARVAEVDAILRRLGAQNIFRQDVVQPSGALDACFWLRNFLENHVDPSVESGGLSIGYPLGQTGIDRVAGIMGVMSMLRPDIFVGTGPYRYVSQDADGVHFEAFPGYHGGVAATRYVDFVRSAGVRSSGDGSDLAAGAVDIVPDYPLGTAFEATAASHDVRVIHPPAPGFLVLSFNVREGRLFSDVNLRRALQLCIDLPRDVDAATGGSATPVYGPVLPGSWADDPDLPQPDRDVAAARRLIESSGWQLGPDGVYMKGKVRLAAKVPVRADVAERVKMVDLIVAQARGCGMDLESLPLEGFYSGSTTPAGAVFTYPHYLPDTKTPFDVMVFGSGGSGPDPGNGPLLGYTSDQISDSEYPDGSNFGGFGDPEFDRLMAAASATYDQADRARLLREAQQELAAQLPTIFLWGMTRYDSLRTAVATVDGPLDLTLPNWAWQPERMVVEAGSQ